MDFEQAKKVLQLTETRIKKFGSIDTSTSDEIHKAIFRFQPFQRLVIAYHAQEALTRLREQTAPLENSLEQLRGSRTSRLRGVPFFMKRR
jgi:hypothetical protein